MLPQYERLDNSKPLIQIPFGKFAVATVCLPLLGFIFCVVWSILFFFDESTSTHCNVTNFLPSISAAIGHYQPQKFIWQLVISLHTLPRFITLNMYVKYYEEVIRINKRTLAYLVCFLNAIEILSLLGLSLYTSSEYYEMHKFFFVTFIVMSELYMLFSYILYKKGRKMSSLTKVEKTSIISKRLLFLTNLLAFMTAIYFFGRHNSYCEPGIYSVFAFFEYIVILTNMAFHMTAYYDFFGKNLVFDWYKGMYLSHM